MKHESKKLADGKGYSVTCAVCDKTFIAPTKGKASLAMSLHTNRVHTRKVTSLSGGWGKLRKPGKKNKDKVSREDEGVHEGHGVAVNYCPSCGCNIGAVQVALSLSGTIKQAIDRQLKH